MILRCTCQRGACGHSAWRAPGRPLRGGAVSSPLPRPPPGPLAAVRPADTSLAWDVNIRHRGRLGHSTSLPRFLPDGFREVRASSQSRWAARSPAMNSSQRGPSPRPGENRHLGRPALWGRMHQPHPLAWEVNSPPPTPRGRDPCVEVRLGVGEVRSAAKQV